MSFHHTPARFVLVEADGRGMKASAFETEAEICERLLFTIFRKEGVEVMDEVIARVQKTVRREIDEQAEIEERYDDEDKRKSKEDGTD